MTDIPTRRAIARPLVNMRVGSRARCSSSTYSSRRSLTGVDPNITTQVAVSIIRAPYRMVGGAFPVGRRRSAHTHASKQASLRRRTAHGSHIRPLLPQTRAARRPRRCAVLLAECEPEPVPFKHRLAKLGIVLGIEASRSERIPADRCGSQPAPASPRNRLCKAKRPRFPGPFLSGGPRSRTSRCGFGDHRVTDTPVPRGARIVGAPTQGGWQHKCLPAKRRAKARPQR